MDGIYSLSESDRENILNSFIDGIPLKKLSKQYNLEENDLKRHLVFELSEGYGRKIIHNDIELLNSLINEFYNLAIKGDVKAGALLNQYLQHRQGISGAKSLVDTYSERILFKKYRSIGRF